MTVFWGRGGMHANGTKNLVVSALAGEEAVCEKIKMTMSCLMESSDMGKCWEETEKDDTGGRHNGGTSITEMRGVGTPN
jgi:hypothetical protein